MLAGGTLRGGTYTFEKVCKGHGTSISMDPSDAIQRVRDMEPVAGTLRYEMPKRS
jgi:hypothetical protein